MKKDFAGVNTGRVYDTMQEATAQEDTKKRKERRTYTEREAQEILQTGKTSGRKGVRLPRINIGFTPDVYDYVQTMSRVAGLTMTDFVNIAIREHMQNHLDTYTQALEFRNSL